MAEREVEYFSGIKTAQNRKVELKLKEEDVPGAILYLERKKNRRMHRETALEMISSPGSQNN